MYNDQVENDNDQLHELDVENWMAVERRNEELQEDKE